MAVMTVDPLHRSEVGRGVHAIALSLWASPLRHRVLLGFKKTLAWRAHNSTMIRAFSAHHAFGELNPGRARCAGMSDAFGVERGQAISVL